MNFTVISQPVMPETVELKEGRLTLHEGESQSLTATPDAGAHPGEARGPHLEIL